MRARPITAPDSAAQLAASTQVVSGSSGTVGGLSPVAPRQISVSARSAAAAAATADSVARTFHRIDFTTLLQPPASCPPPPPTTRRACRHPVAYVRSQQVDHPPHDQNQ